MASMPASDISSAASSSSYRSSSMRAPTNSSDRLLEVLDRPAFRRAIHERFFSASVVGRSAVSSMKSAASGIGAAAGAGAGVRAGAGAAGAGTGTAGAGTTSSGAASGAAFFLLKKLNMDMWGRVGHAHAGAVTPARRKGSRVFYQRDVLTNRQRMNRLRIRIAGYASTSCPSFPARPGSGARRRRDC